MQVQPTRRRITELSVMQLAVLSILACLWTCATAGMVGKFLDNLATLEKFKRAFFRIYIRSAIVDQISISAYFNATY